MSNAQNKIVGTIFSFGFVIGAIFSYSGIMGFAAGFSAGVMFAKTYLCNQETSEWVEVSTQSTWKDNVFSALEQVKTWIATRTKVEDKP